MWIGPPPAALRAAGDKVTAKELAAAAAVPVVPGGAPAELGLPLLVKAAAGGGGRGMRVVRSFDELDDAVAAAEREALTAFGDGRLLFERYLERPRHIEIQLLADRHGTVRGLGERECSVQRRHQKVLEESPSPALDPPSERAMTEAAWPSRAVGYVGAGTAEFVLADDEFFFLELNARIQVEHPVTEAVTGVDLVEWQLRIADGERLAELPPAAGHAVEARLYAEDPQTFLPRSGRLEHLRLPTAIRVDAGVEQGDVVGTAYDPLLAKLIAHGPTRDAALERLGAALAETEVAGVTTNLLPPLARGAPALRAGETTTAFLVEHPPLSPPPALSPGRPWRRPFRLNLPSPPPAPPPDLAADAAPALEPGTSAAVAAPMPGTVLRVLVGPGDKVEARQPLVVLEAMKMETPLLAPFAATVAAVHVREGDRVSGGTIVVELEQ
jgi:acetyl/propionyl-CoA carboxylase alpha subunit